MVLLIDIGNTRLKWAQYQGGMCVQTGAIAHVNNCIHESLLTEWNEMQSPQKIYMSVVSSTKISQVLFEVVGQMWPSIQIHEIHTEKYAHGVTNAYSKPEKLGVDRWLTLLAAYHFYTTPVCIVDCGTAITLDVLDQQGMHLGGMIMPGLALMRQSLYMGTEGLNVCTKRHQQGLANDTEAAIYNGNLSAVKGFIEFGLAHFNKPLQLIVCGGDAELIVDTLKLNAIVDKQLVFKGLAVSSGEWVAR